MEAPTKTCPHKAPFVVVLIAFRPFVDGPLVVPTFGWERAIFGPLFVPLRGRVAVGLCLPIFAQWMKNFGPMQRPEGRSPFLGPSTLPAMVES